MQFFTFKSWKKDQSLIRNVFDRLENGKRKILRIGSMKRMLCCAYFKT
ncbi:hypothetical protein LSS_08309 [Leptospira santarosai serovar Shermani str. LT 821]|uniref:Uncharacterized protein n=1 Tax=Leptospira santarosai serovar Shermani str. LT 821 TaxID=758847 RepID=K8YA30_9LEPT|nr:hypothetical protein LSS_08309 [Leptospira santarosai serovar Shermani str. LT 821]